MINNNGVLVARSDDLSPDHGEDGGSGVGLKKGPWTAAEDAILIEYVKKHGEGNWNAVQKNSGLSRCGKSCRLRWANHLRPNLKKGSFSPEEEKLILELHAKLGNKWARMAAQLPGRTDNEIKNYWNTRVKRRQRAGLPLYPQDIQKQAVAFHLHHPNQTRPSLSPPPLTQQFSSSHQRKPNLFSSPLSLFNPTSISTTSFLPSQFHEFKRFRGNNNFGFTPPFSLSNNPQSQSSLFSPNFSNQLQPSSTFQFNSGNFDLNPPPIVQTPIEPDGLVGSGSIFPIKVQLPSIQLPQQAANTADSGATGDYKLTKSNSGLLDALLEEAQAMASSEDSKRENKRELDQLFHDALASESAFSQNEMKLKEEPKDDINSVDDELSSLLNIIPPTMSMAEWGYSDSGEISNGQSSGLTEDDIGLEMKHVASSLPASNTSDQDYWNLTNWNNMPGIC